MRWTVRSTRARRAPGRLPRCRAELDGLREVAAAIGNTVEPLPEGLWSNIASRLPERPDDDESPPMPRLVAEAPSHPAGSRPHGSRAVAATSWQPSVQ